MEKDNQNNPIDERCLPHRDENYKPRHAWADAVEKRCTPIPEDGAYRSRHLAKESETSVHRPDPIPSDWLEKGTHYDAEGNLITPEGVYDDPIMPEGSDSV